METENIEETGNGREVLMRDIGGKEDRKREERVRSNENPNKQGTEDKN